MIESAVRTMATAATRPGSHVCFPLLLGSELTASAELEVVAAGGTLRTSAGLLVGEGSESDGDTEAAGANAEAGDAMVVEEATGALVIVEDVLVVVLHAAGVIVEVEFVVDAWRSAQPIRHSRSGSESSRRLS